MKIRHLIIGGGEVGQALKKVLKKAHVIDHTILTKQIYQEQYEIMHICIPYSSEMEEAIKLYEKNMNQN